MTAEACYVEPVEPVLRHFIEDFRNIVARALGATSRVGSLSLPVRRSNPGAVERETLDGQKRTVARFVSRYTKVDGGSLIGRSRR